MQRRQTGIRGSGRDRTHAWIESQRMDCAIVSGIFADCRRSWPSQCWSCSGFRGMAPVQYSGQGREETVSEPIRFLEPRPAVISRRSTIIDDLADLLPPECLVHEPRELVPFETDAFVAYRRL